MSTEQELEVKFYLRDLPALEQRLLALGAQLVQERVREVNLRFDTPAGELAAARQVLRLRLDQASRMTYKGPAEVRSDISARQEIEFSVSDFVAARHLLEALGFEVCVMYEKYRRTYDLENLHVTLDEMPYGTFAEIEGPTSAEIQDAAQKLGLAWSARVLDSYLGIFEKLKQVLPMEGRDLSFEHLSGVEVLPEHLNLGYADQGSGYQESGA